MDKLIEINNQLMAAPGGVLIILVTTAIWLALRRWHKFPDNIIPVLLMLFGLVLWLGFACAHFPADGGFRKSIPWLSGNICIGLILPAISWMMSSTIIKGFEKKWGVTFGNGNTEIFTNPNPPSKQSPEQTNENTNP